MNLRAQPLALLLAATGCTTTLREHAPSALPPTEGKDISLHTRDELERRDDGPLYLRGESQPFSGVIRLNGDGSTGKPVRNGHETSWVLDGPVREGNTCPAHGLRNE